MLIIIKDFVNMHLFVEILRRCMILCVSALCLKKIEEKEGKERRKGKKKLFIGLIRVGRHSGWMFSGLMAF